MKAFGFEVTIEELQALFQLIGEGAKRLRIPKCKKNTIGLVIALRTESNHDKKLLEAELVRELELRLAHTGFGNVFSIVRFDDWLSSKITTPEQAELYLKRSRGHLIIYGNLVQRQSEGSTKYVFKLFGLVRHRRISLEIAQRFKLDFASMLPSQVAFPQSEELLGFEVTRQWLGDTAAYITAVAAGLSGSLDLSEKLLSVLEFDLGNRIADQSHPALGELRKRLNLRMIEIRHARIASRYKSFVNSRDRSTILESKDDVADLVRRDPDDYRAKLTTAMILYFENKTNDAIQLLERVQNPDATWRFSLGFLYAFIGDADKAWDQYKRAFRGEFPQNVVLDVELFYVDAIELHPDKPQLLFFRGLLNLKSKCDYDLARQDFSSFLQHREFERFGKLQSSLESTFRPLMQRLAHELPMRESRCHR